MKKRSILTALLVSIRPTACLGVAFLTTAGFGNLFDHFHNICTFIISFIGAAGCFLINDLSDREKDLKNNKMRPLVTGELPVKVAIITAICCCAILYVATFFDNINYFFVTTLLIGGFWSYSYINLHFGLLANIWVSVCFALTLSLSMINDGPSQNNIFAMLCVLFVNIAREILLDSLDQVGDKAVGKPTIPIKYGDKITIKYIFAFYTLATIVIFIYGYINPSTWIWMLLLLTSIWLPYVIKRKNDFRKWSLFNIRTSHLFFLIIIIILFAVPNKGIAQSPITTAYTLEKLDQLQNKEDGFFPKGIFSSERKWFSGWRSDNNVFSTAWTAYILKSVNDRLKNDKIDTLYKQSLVSFENFRNRNGEASYNYWQSINGDIPFPNSKLLAKPILRLPDDYDCTALIQLSRGVDSLDQAVRDRMLTYGMRANRGIVKEFPAAYNNIPVFETWYATKMRQDLDLVVMANVMLFTIDKGFPYQEIDKNTIACLKTSINEGWYFSQPKRVARYYNRPALIMYSIARLVAKDPYGDFTNEKEILKQHLYKQLKRSNNEVDKVMLIVSLQRLGENVSHSLSRKALIKDAEFFVFTNYKFKYQYFYLYIAPAIRWKCEALAWALVTEMLSYSPNITWKA